MIRNRNHRASPVSAWLMAAVLFALILQASAQSPSSVGQGFGAAYEPAHEVAVAGTVDRFVPSAAQGGPAGLHLLISASGKSVDAHLGPFFSTKNQEALAEGQPVQVVGVKANVNGREVLLARQVIFAGRVVTVRNQRGFLVREHPARRITRDSKPAPNGGAQ
jgi:hypothetical protein